MNAIFAIIGFTRLGIKPESIAPEADALNLKLLPTLNQYFSDCFQIVPRRCMLDARVIDIY